MITTFEPFSYSWQRTKEINDLLMKEYVFPALTDAILSPDMFGYKYNDQDDGNYDELHYMQHLEDRGGLWCYKRETST